MTAALREACAGLARELPRAAVLIGEPDREGRAAVTLPAKSSHPPWNSLVANAVLDPHTGIRRLRAQLHQEVTGQPLRYVPAATRATGATIRAVTDLSMIDGRADEASRWSTDEYASRVSSWVTAIQQLPAVDEAERFIRVHGVACHHCGNTMLRLGERSGRLTCVRWGACFDHDGQHPTGFVTAGHAGAMVAWADGCNQYAELRSEAVP